MQNVDSIIHDIINREIEGIRNIPINDTITKAVEAIYQSVHQRGGKLVVSGLGKAGQIGHNIATTLSSTGTPAAWSNSVCLHRKAGI